MYLVKIILLFAVLCGVVAQEVEETTVQARGKGKYALLMHFFYVAATKLFILKVIYGVIFYVILTKGWHLALWLIHYLKEKEIPHEHYIEYDHHHDHYDHHFDHHGHYDRVQYLGHDLEPYSPPKTSYGKFDVSYTNRKKGVYDSDGSYSVKNS